MGERKMWLVVRADIKMSPGKLAAQSGHAFGRLYRLVSETDSLGMAAYQADAETKIVTRVESLDALFRVSREAAQAGIPCVTIQDAGRSEVEAGTRTVAAFGPARRDELPSFLQRLRLL